MSDTILVTGASGHLGRAIVTHLLESQTVAPSRIIAGTRDPARLADLAVKGVTVRKVDFDAAPADLEASLKGADTVLVVSTDALDGAGTRLRQHKAAIAAAANAGARRIAYASLPKADTSHVSFAPDHLGSEEAVKATGLSHLIFRNSWYLENLFMSLPNSFASGQWYTSAGQGRTAFVARDDIAAAIAGALASPPSGSMTYTLTGSAAVSNDEIAKVASEIVGKPLQVVHLNDEQLAGGMKGAGVPDAVIPTLVSFDTAAREGDLATVTNDVAKLAGKEPKSLRDFLLANKAAFAA